MVWGRNVCYLTFQVVSARRHENAEGLVMQPLMWSQVGVVGFSSSFTCDGLGSSACVLGFEGSEAGEGWH